MRGASDPVGYRRGLVLGLTLAETLLLVLFILLLVYAALGQEREKKLKEQPYVDLRVEAQDVEEVVQKAVKDLIANVEENHAMQTMLRQIERELKEIEEKAKTAKRVTGAIRKRDGSPTNAEDQAIEQKRAAKYGVLKKAQQLKAKNEEEKTMISRFLVNFCRQGRRAELEERVTTF